MMAILRIVWVTGADFLFSDSAARAVRLGDKDAMNGRAVRPNSILAVMRFKGTVWSFPQYASRVTLLRI
jgi:hypothetical protein